MTEKGNLHSDRDSASAEKGRGSISPARQQRPDTAFNGIYE